MNTICKCTKVYIKYKNAVWDSGRENGKLIHRLQLKKDHSFQFSINYLMEKGKAAKRILSVRIYGRPNVA